MRFEHQNLLWLLIPAILGLGAFFWWSWRVRQRLIGQFVRSRLLAHLTVGLSASRQKWRMSLLVAVVALIIMVLARPQWGFDWQEARQRGLDIVVAIDTSRSMLAADVPPNRLARARLAALDLKRLARVDRVGLVAFAGSAFLQCPLSFDDEAFRQSVNALDVNIIPLGGSAIAEAIETARAAFKEKNDNYKVLLLFTDGEDNDGRALETAERAAKDGLRIFTIGVGTASGELLRITDAKGRSDFVRDEQGNVIKSRLNEEMLRGIARAAHGFYLPLAGANTMEMLYERGLEPLPKSEHTARRIKRFHERYQWLLAVAIMLLLLEMFLPERKRARRVVDATAMAQKPQAVAAALVLCLSALPSAASPASALKKYEAGKYESARRDYETALREKPDDPRLHYNVGAAAYQAKNYEKAAKHFNASLVTQDLKLQQAAYYNLGNALYRSGEESTEPNARQTHWQQSLEGFESALKLDPQDADARHNYEVVKNKLEELKQQQKNSGDSDKDQQEKKDEQSSKDEKDQEQQKKDQEKQQTEQQQQQEKPSSQDQQKEGQQDKDQPPPGAPPPEKKDESAQQSKPEQNKPEGQNDSEGAPQNPQMIQMTPEQAQRLLEAAKSDEKVMIFAPQIRTNRQNRILKDW
ncbi:MAG: VWA domain-containing protein [Verrucomicrobia subdivision 3 bacterium]|nr:VWA domain-containing protein [Limisphaerales bacterium]